MAFSPKMKRTAIGIALLVVLFTACPLIMRVNPGPPPDFRESRGVYRWRDGRWTGLPHLAGGAESIAISPSGAVWAESPSGKGIDRWDGTRWTHYKGSDFGAVRDQLPGGFALQGDEVWAAAREGVARFDGKRWRLYPEAVVTRSAVAMAAGPSGVWIIDQPGNLSHFDGGRWGIEDLKNTPAGADWKKRVEDDWPELRVTADGAVWLLLEGLWRKDDAGWREIKLDNVDWYDTTAVGQDGGSVWLRGHSHIFEVRADGGMGRVFDFRELPASKGAAVFRLVAGGGKLWLATAKDLLTLDGREWRRYGIPPGTTLLTELTLGADGSPWVVAETRSTWRVAMWVAPPLGACALALLVIGTLLVLWAKGSAEARLERERAAGAVPAADLAASQAGVRRQVRALWWQVPLFLIGFPFALEAVALSRTYLRFAWPGAPEWLLWVVVLAPVAAIGAFLVRWWVRERAESGRIVGSTIWVVFVAAVFFFVLDRLLVSASPVASILTLFGGILVFAFILLRWNFWVAKQALKVCFSGDYDGALRWLRWAAFGGRSPYMLSVEGRILYLAGRIVEAERCFRRSVAYERSKKPAIRGQLLCFLGYALTDQGRYDEARRCLEDAIAMGDKSGDARIGVAELFVAQGKEPEKVVALIEEVMKIRGSPAAQSEPAATKAWALALLDRQSEMEAAIAFALREIPQSFKAAQASVHWRVGKALLVAQRTPEAIDHFRMACQADPQGHHGALARRELEKLSTPPLPPSTSCPD
jgi:tetratricopeptide (TPR) repeat protein